MFSPLPLSLISLHLSHTHRRRVLLELEDQAPDERAAIGVRELDLGDVPSLSPTPLPHPLSLFRSISTVFLSSFCKLNRVREQKEILGEFG